VSSPANKKDGNGGTCSSILLGCSLGDKVMNSTYTAVIKQDANWWIGWIEEVPGVNCQESSREKLLKSLRDTLAEALEFNRAEESFVANIFS
jgi:predicted RNase H-like HicB family nuclease